MTAVAVRTSVFASVISGFHWPQLLYFKVHVGWVYPQDKYSAHDGRKHPVVPAATVHPHKHLIVLEIIIIIQASIYCYIIIHIVISIYCYIIVHIIISIYCYINILLYHCSYCYINILLLLSLVIA